MRRISMLVCCLCMMTAVAMPPLESAYAPQVTAHQAMSYDWPLHDPFTVIDTISTLQFYGSKPGFHHGVDIRAAAGAAVYAPVAGVVGMGYYYPRAQVPYTYEVFVDGDDGFRWEFHHIDQQTIPQQVADLAKQHGRVERGVLLARIYDAPKFDPDIPAHVHVDVIDRDGVYHNPLKFFPQISDKTAPKIEGIYVVDSSNKVVAGNAQGIGLPALLPSGKYELVLDIIDIIDGAPMGDSVARLSVSANGTSIGHLDFLDRLPKKNYLEGINDVYKIEPIVLPDGKALKNQVDLSGPRKFLYRFDLDTSKLTVSADGVIKVDIMAEDFAHNSTQSTVELRLRMPQ